MKKIVIIFIIVGILTHLVPADSVFSKKADLLMAKNSGRVYEIGSNGFIIVEGKRGLKTGEKLAPRVVLFKSKSFASNGLEQRSISSNAASATYEIDILKYEF